MERPSDDGRLLLLNVNTGLNVHVFEPTGGMGNKERAGGDVSRGVAGVGHDRGGVSERAGDHSQRQARYSITLVPIRPRSRGERRFLRTFSPGVVSLRPGSLAHNPDTPRRLSTPLLTPLNSTPTSLCMERLSGWIKSSRISGTTAPTYPFDAARSAPRRRWSRCSRSAATAGASACGAWRSVGCGR